MPEAIQCQVACVGLQVSRRGQGRHWPQRGALQQELIALALNSVCPDAAEGSRRSREVLMWEVLARAKGADLYGGAVAHRRLQPVRGDEVPARRLVSR